MASRKHQILIIGGGSAGITVAAIIRRRHPSLDIGLIEPSEVHYYQPAFTLVGCGSYAFNKTVRPEITLIPEGVAWIRERCASFAPESNEVILGSGERISYDFLVVCPGIKLDWGKVKGLPEALGTNGICSNYSPDSVRYTNDCLRRFEKGSALFTQPPMPIKCPGAPQKIAYLACDIFQERGILYQSNVEFYTALPVIFGVPFFAKALEQVLANWGITPFYQHNLVEIDGPGKIATFEKVLPDQSKERLTRSFDMIHVTPPQCAPDFVKESSLANAAGFVEVDDHTLQHKRYPNVFALGDAASTANSKTAAAVRKQAPVVIKNIVQLMAGKPLPAKYDGYASCPLVTSRKATILAEFSYGGKVTPTFPLMNPRENRYIWWLVKKYGLPPMYWDYMLKGYDWDVPHREAYAKPYLDPA